MLYIDKTEYCMDIFSCPVYDFYKQFGFKPGDWVECWWHCLPENLQVLIFNNLPATERALTFYLGDNRHEKIRIIVTSGIDRVTAFVDQVIVTSQQIIFYTVLTGYIDN